MIFWRKFDRHNCFHSALPSIGQEIFFLNPLLDNDTLYKDFNDTYDYKDYLDYDNNQYVTSDTNSSDEFSTVSYYEQDTRSTSDSEIHYDASSTIANFLTDSITDFYTSSTLSQSETTASTTIESNTMEGILHFLCLYIELIITQIYII